MKRFEWYVEATGNGDGWTLNECRPNGWLATFGQEAEAHQAAHEHNAHVAMVVALETLLAEWPDCGCCPETPDASATTCGACLARAALALSE